MFKNLILSIIISAICIIFNTHHLKAGEYVGDGLLNLTKKQYSSFQKYKNLFNPTAFLITRSGSVWYA